jgi:hypothetical protein
LRFEAAEGGFAELLEGGEFGAEGAGAFGGDAVGLAAVFGRERLDPALLLETGDGSIESAGAEAGAAEAGDVVDHGVAVLGAARKRGEDEEWWVRVVTEAVVIAGCGFCGCYVSRTTHDVVISQETN